MLEAVKLINTDSAQYFSVFDTKNGSINLSWMRNQKISPHFLVLTPFGRYRYERAPFGINRISEHNKQRMQEILEGMECVDTELDMVIIYTT